MAISQLHFECIKNWFVQSDGLSMGASLALILANNCFKKMCPQCNKKNYLQVKKGSARDASTGITLNAEI